MGTEPVVSNLRSRWLRWRVAILISVAAAAWAESARTQVREQVFLPGEAQDQRLQCGGRLESLVKAAEFLEVGTSAPADPLCKLSPEVAALPPIATCASQQLSCESCLEKFVQHMDGILASRARSIESLNTLVNRVFPLKACNVDEVLKITAKSHYFAAAEESPNAYSIWFGNGKDRSHTTYVVGFALLKKSGDSYNEYAQFLK